MTAIVGVLNKHAVAIAADSAVTVNVSSGHKVLNSANKIITLSKLYPIAVMIYSSASFMGTPWDLIIKLYRNKLQDKEKSSIKEYVEDFISFLKQKQFFCSDKNKTDALCYYAFVYYKKIEEEALLKIGENVTDDNKPFLLKTIKEKMLSNKMFFEKQNQCEGLASYTFEQFNSYVGDIFKGLRDYIVNKTGAPEEFFEILKESFFALLKSEINLPSYTGLVFVGYGKDDIYPSLLPINISLAFDNVVKYSIDMESSTVIGEDNAAAICPFAQTDVIETVLTGIDPLLNKSIENLFIKSLEAYSKLLKTYVESTTNDVSLLKRIDSIDIPSIGTIFNDAIQQLISKQYIAPLVDTVAYLEKEDMADMAESLISLTYLKRRMTSSEESVGGPVDVAIISKTDGVIWIKRKHYFKPELNHHFFDNYYKF